MEGTIRIKKGLNINLSGKAEKTIVISEKAELYAVKPTDFHGIVPKLNVKVDDRVKAGTVLFHDKKVPEIKFTSPVSGTVKAINRGERRQILELVVAPDDFIEYEDFKKENASGLTRNEVIQKLLDSGLWPSIIQRPFNIIANPRITPKAIFISAFDTSPLAPDYNFVLNGLENEFQAGLDALLKLTDGKIHLNIHNGDKQAPGFAKSIGIQLNYFSGPHPAGNVGTQINKIDPINKGEVVWSISPQNLVTIGRLFLTGKYDATRIVALTGSEAVSPKYYKTISGACIRSIAHNNIKEGKVRYISGNVLSGTKVYANGFLGFYDSQITIVPEGDTHEFLGWIKPGLNKFSASKTFLSRLFPAKEYRIDTNLNGGKRTLMITGQFEKVFPMDIYPLQLLKAMIIEDIELMENLGVYEIVEEDFALCEFIDTSKTDIQSIVRKGLDLMIKEMN